MELQKENIYELLFKIISVDEKITFESNLYNEYSLDSLGVIDLILALEESFGIELSDDDLILDNFESINKISELIDLRMGNK
ncbi:MAG: acyl carrier protein [Bacteroidales bacterium]|jgi:acyl carrier protein|nr:acyl carrier protein [Bacteroidales bacterium]